MQEGDFSSAVSELRPTPTISPAERVAAQRFFSRHRDLRRRFLEVTDIARKMEEDGGQVTALRDALARALSAAARRDHSATVRHIETAESAMQRARLVVGRASPDDASREGCLGRIAQLGPSYRLGRDLLTEGHGVADKLLRRARGHYEREDYEQALVVVRLAAELSAVDLAPLAVDTVPEWFAALEPLDPAAAGEEEAVAAIALCESMVAASEPSPPVRSLLRNAMLAQTAKRWKDAYWWAQVALNALGLSDREVAAATASPTVTTPDPNPESSPPPQGP
jgi:hypothetical protein